MTDDELDEVRRILVAFEDASTWCRELAEVATRAPGGETRPGRESDRTRSSIADILRQLDSHHQQVVRIRKRIGLGGPLS